MAKKPRNRKTKKPRKPRSHTRTEGKIYTPSHEVTRSRGAKKLRNRETKKPRKPRSLKEPKAQRPRAHPDQKTKIPPRPTKKKSQNKYASYLKHAPSFGDSASSLTRARIRRWPFTIYLKHAPFFWRFRFIIYLKHAPSFGDSGTPYSLVCRCNARSTARLIDGSVGRRTDWLTDSPLPLDDRLTDWLTDWLTAARWPTDWLTDWLAARLADRLTDWLTARLALRLTDRSVGCQPTDWLAASLTDWLARLPNGKP